MVVDLSHYLGLPEDTPAAARRMAAQLGDIVRAATVGDAGQAWESALPCRRRPAHRTCPGRTVVQRPVAGGPIRWQCTRCDDTGTISSWERSSFDLRPRGFTGVEATTDVVVTDDVAAALRDLQLLDPECERLVYGFRAHPDGAVLSVSDAALENLVGAVAAEANREPNRRRQQRLDRAYDALDTAPQHHDRRRLLAPVALPELDVARVQRWCIARVPDHARHEVRVECQVAPRHLTIVERRAPWRADLGPEWTTFPIARLRYTATEQTWTLYWRDRNLRFYHYDRTPPAARIEDLLHEVDRDPTSIFWG